MQLPTTRRLPLGVLVLALMTALVVQPAMADPLPRPDAGRAIDAYPRYEAPRTCRSEAQPGVVEFRGMLRDAYGANAGGIRRRCAGTNATSDHHEGRAYDWMMNASRPADRAKVDEVLDWLLATDEHGNKHAMARRLGISYIIWNHQRWRAYHPDEGWTRYPGSHPHDDHVHFSFSWDGALQRTSYWDSFRRPAPPRNPFPDVPRSSYYGQPVDWLSQHAITTGFGNTGEFRPHEPVTRAQMAAFLHRMMGAPTGYPDHGFTDVPSNAYYRDAVRWLRHHGYTEGAGSTRRFEPNRVLTRGEMAEFIWRVAGRPTGSPRHYFPDISSSRYYDRSVSWMVDHGLTTGYGETGRFEASRPVTRAHTAAFLHRFASTKAAWSQAANRPGTVTFR